MTSRQISSIAVALALYLTAVPAGARPVHVTNPEATMRTVFAALEKDRFDIELPLSGRLMALMALDRREAGKGNVGRLDGDYIVGAQETKVSAAVVTANDVYHARERRIIVVRYRNLGKPKEGHFFWERDARRGWVLDDVRTYGADGDEILSLLLKYGWDAPEGRTSAPDR